MYTSNLESAKVKDGRTDKKTKYAKPYEDGLHKCSILGTNYEGYGNNAYPFKGRCSDEANSWYVIPARLMGISPEQIEKFGKKAIMEFINDKFKNR